MEERAGSPEFDREVDRRLLARAEKGDVVITSYTLPWLAKDGVKVWLVGEQEEPGGEDGQAGLLLSGGVRQGDRGEGPRELRALQEALRDRVREGPLAVHDDSRDGRGPGRGGRQGRAQAAPAPDEDAEGTTAAEDDPLDLPDQATGPGRWSRSARSPPTPATAGSRRSGRSRSSSTTASSRSTRPRARRATRRSRG